MIDSETPFDFDQREKEGWTLLEDVNDVSGGALLLQIELVEFYKDGESAIDGEEMARRAKEELDANSSQHRAELLLKNQDKISVGCRKCVLVFPGTKWGNRGGCRDIACLDFDLEDNLWVMDFHWLGSHFPRYCRLVRFRKPVSAA